MKLLLVAATEAEIAPTMDWINSFELNDPIHERITVLITGVGMMATTFKLTQALINNEFSWVIGAGIAGSYDFDIPLGTCVLVKEEILGDLGAEDHEDFLNAFELRLMQKDEAPFIDGRLPNPTKYLPFSTKHLKMVSGLTVNTVSGNSGTISARKASFNPDIESMEGAALHYVCLKMNQAFLQLRAISNYVTPRDRPSWKIAEAISSLNTQLIEWLQS